MLDQLKQEIIEVLQQNQLGHIALSSSDRPWASAVRFVNVGLTLYLIEPSASDLVFYIESNSLVAFTISVDKGQAGSVKHGPQSIQIFGTASIVSRQELPDEPKKVQTTFALKSRQFPGVYVVVKIEPRRIYRVVHDQGVTRRDTLDNRCMDN